MLITYNEQGQLSSFKIKQGQFFHIFTLVIQLEVFYALVKKTTK
jgi:hypothetical protein